VIRDQRQTHWKDQLQRFDSPRTCGQARPARPRDTCKQRKRAPVHGTESQIPSSQCQRTCLPNANARQSLSRLMGRSASRTDRARSLWSAHSTRHTQVPARARGAWWSQTGSNRRPPACKAGALPTELWPQSGGRCQGTGVRTNASAACQFLIPDL
jgi:hypothetical protein